MNNKKYISVGVFAVIVMVGAGVAYYFDPAAINNVLGIGSAQIDAVSDADVSILDDGSSSAPAFDQEIDADETSLPTAPSVSTQKSAQKSGQKSGKSTSFIAASGTQTDEGSEQATVITANGAATTGSPAASSPSSAPAPVSSCAFPSAAPSATKKVLINEVAWMGSPSSSNAEWMELKNNSAGAIDLSGWELANASGKIKISFSDGDTIAPGGFMILARGGANARTYSGDLANAGDVLALMDAQCAASDYLDASLGWPGGSNATKATLERDADGVGWHTSAAPGGTPGAENSAGPPPVQYALTVSFQGNASGATITSDPAGLACGTSCTGSFASGTRITLTPAAGPSSTFIGWSGMCYGETICSFTINANANIVAEFNAAPSARSAPPPASPTTVTSSDTDPDNGGAADISSSSAPTEPAASTSSSVTPAGPSGHVLIAAVQIAGASSDNDFVKLYNPTSAAIDVSGWKLHKRSQTGADYSLKTFPAGSTIAPGQSFVWANSTNGFSGTIGADVSSTETLSANNSVALLDGAGTVVDAVAWGTGTGQYGEGAPFPTSPGANQTLARRSSGGVMADMDSNADDFTIQ